MSRFDRAAQLVIGGFALTAVVVLAGIGGSLVSTNRNGTGFFLAATWIFGAALFSLILIYVVWPVFPRLFHLRVRLRGPDGVVAREELPPSDGSDFQVLKALYGTKSRRDVTGFVLPQVKRGRLKLVAQSDALGGDPDPDGAKTLTIVYRHNGRNKVRAFDEGADVNLP